MFSFVRIIYRDFVAIISAFSYDQLTCIVQGIFHISWMDDTSNAEAVAKKKLIQAVRNLGSKIYFFPGSKLSNVVASCIVSSSFSINRPLSFSLSIPFVLFLHFFPFSSFSLRFFFLSLFFPPGKVEHFSYLPTSFSLPPTLLPFLSPVRKRLSQV